MSEARSPFRSVTTWFISCVAIVVVLTYGMLDAAVTPDSAIEGLDRPVVPPGGWVELEGPGQLNLHLNGRDFPAGWMPTGTFEARVTFPDGVQWSGPISLGERERAIISCVEHACTSRSELVPRK